ncbi:hypothetical protein H6G89_23680 [Oscillatoria sp. FACHB-1407]|uniref:alr0857 family protein n=1 Tax=Oscillatoria sp. FACHB-1407 TaxID=2692847 RepID=UPI001688E2F5|nr:alr0857 family protein [Oscillatoria sp. FACHB-1407]MBD2464007.1 hypothetical protein [Oscillatoria sp. FACHB-1407]
MLKLTYTETTVHLEQIAQSLEEWIALRVILSVRMAQRMVLEQGSASILLPTDLVQLHALEQAVRQEPGHGLELAIADESYVEISFKGIWLLAPQEGLGVFVAALSHRTEFVLVKLWQDTYADIPSLR